MKHCDEYIDDESQPDCLREFVRTHRLPAVEKKHPLVIIYADYRGARVALTMASRFGDVGITPVLKNPNGYESRVMLAELSNFSVKP